MSNSEQTTAVKKNAISAKFLVIILLLGFGAYLAGPYVMTYVMLLQEGAKARAPAVQSEMPEGRPTLPSGS